MMTNSTTKVYDEALQERVRKYMKDGLPYHMYRIPRPGGRFNSVFLGA